MLSLRRNESAFARDGAVIFRAFTLDGSSLGLGYVTERERLVAVCCLRGAPRVTLDRCELAAEITGPPWDVLLSTEDPTYASDPQPPRIDCSGAAPAVHFRRPGAVVLRNRE